MTARGIRNHNPGNIRHGEQWQGLAKEQTDPAFCVFISNEYGCRALLKTISTYVKKYNLTTINDIINRWAPASENNTSAYVMYVANALGKGITEKLNFNKGTLIALGKAIASYENGPEAKVLTKDTWEKAYALL